MTTQEIERAAQAADGLGRTLQAIRDNGLIPDDEDIQKIVDAAEAAGQLVANLERALELFSPQQEGGVSGDEANIAATAAGCSPSARR